MILRKLAATTVIAAAIMAAGAWIVRSGAVSLDSFPFLPSPSF
jgi:hypothetical protein